MRASVQRCQRDVLVQVRPSFVTMRLLSSRGRCNVNAVVLRLDANELHPAPAPQSRNKNTVTRKQWLEVRPPWSRRGGGDL